MVSSPSNASAGEKEDKKRLMLGVLVALVVLLLYVAHRQKGYIRGGFAVQNIPEGATIPTPCASTDHLQIDSAAYIAGYRRTDVTKTLQAVYDAQAGNLPYTVNGMALIGGASALDGSLTFKARCPQGRVK
jgi:hypothetical protein